MDVRHDEAMAERPHGISEDVSRHGLRDVLNELLPVGLDALPVFRGTGSLVCDRFAAELVHTDAGLDVAEPTSGRKLDVEHTTFADETNPVRFGFRAHLDRLFHTAVNSSPEFDDARIGFAP